MKCLSFIANEIMSCQRLFFKMTAFIIDARTATIIGRLSALILVRHILTAFQRPLCIYCKLRYLSLMTIHSSCNLPADKHGNDNAMMLTLTLSHLFERVLQKRSYFDSHFLGCADHFCCEFVKIPQFIEPFELFIIGCRINLAQTFTVLSFECLSSLL